MEKSKSVDHLQGQILQKKSQNMVGFLSNTIQDKMNLNIKFRKLGLAQSHSE